MILSDRLMKIAEFIKKDTKVLDIGTDHGYVPIYLVEEGITKHVIASDISKDSLRKTIELVKTKGLEKNIQSRLGDGLEVIKAFEVEGVIMAGMGGILIQNILEKSQKITNSIDYFIFQPMIASKELRKYLIENNFTIVDEEIAQEGDKFYEIILAKRGKEDLKEEIYYEISQILIKKKHLLLVPFIENKIKITNSIIKNLDDKTSHKSRDRKIELNKLVDNYMEVLKKIEA